jgi:hypothetical protein
MSNDLRNELRRAAGSDVERIWNAAEEDFRSTVSLWDRPYPMALLKLIEATQQAFATATIWQALADGWSIEHLFGYHADDEHEVASFGIYTAIGLGMASEVLLVERDIAILRWANAHVEDLGERVSFRYSRKLMDPAGMVVWWKHRRLDPGPGRFAPRPLLDVLSKLSG